MPAYLFCDDHVHTVLPSQWKAALLQNFVFTPLHTHMHTSNHDFFFSVTKLDAILSVKQAVTPSASDSSVTLHTLLKAVELFLEE